VNVVKNNAAFRELQAVVGADGKTATVEFADAPAAEGRSHYRVTVEGTQTPYPEVPGSMALSGNMIALSNPIYFNFAAKF
jgi:hypothetical protein